MKKAIIISFVLINGIQLNAQDSIPLKFYAEVGIQRDFYKNGYKQSDKTFRDIYPVTSRQIGYHCKRNIGPYFSVSSSYKLFEFMDMSIGINYYIFNMHYYQNSVDTLKKYYPDVITEDDEYFTIKHDYNSDFCLNLAPIFNIWRLRISPSVDFPLVKINYGHYERFNGRITNGFNSNFLFLGSFFEIRLGLKMGYGFQIYDRNFIVNTGFLGNGLFLSLKMEI
ncbi:MAG: hypothetical protein ACP5DZ_10145 [Bacteroidales bacterium]